MENIENFQQKLCFILINNCKISDLLDVNIYSILNINSSFIIIYDDEIYSENNSKKTKKIKEKNENKIDSLGKKDYLNEFCQKREEIIEFDLGQYKKDYSYICKLKKKYKDNETDFYSIYNLFEAEKKDEKVILKIIDKEALQKEDDFDFHIERIEKEKEISNLCNSDFILKLFKYYETKKIYSF
jgi:hypothetical protein